VAANGGVYVWKDGRTNADTFTAVFDYGPDDDKNKGFQVVYHSRMHNGAGGTKEYYYSNGGMLNLDTNKITPEGGLNQKLADEMGMQANLLPEMSLSDVLKVETSANTGSDPMTSLHMRNWMECVRSRKEPNARPRRATTTRLPTSWRPWPCTPATRYLRRQERGHCHGVILPKTEGFQKPFGFILPTCSNHEATISFGSGPCCGGCRLPGPVQNRHDRVQLSTTRPTTRDVLVEGKPFTSYIYPGPDVIKKPVLYPILTAQGTPITRGFPMEPRAGERVDHPHHVGMWLNYGDVNGHDFWNNSNDVGDHPGPFGTIVHKGIKTMKGGKERGELTVTADWLDKDGKPMLQETTTYYFGGSGNGRTIDRITTLKALGQDILFKDNKEAWSPSAVRRELEHPSNKPEVFTDASGKATDVPTMNNEGVTGRYRSSEGVEGEDVWGKRARWMNLTGKVGNENISVALLDHPQNVGYPTYCIRGATASTPPTRWAGRP
jgi:hypothetical protein